MVAPKKHLQQPTVKISKELKTRLDGFKVHKRQPYTEVIEKALLALETISSVWDQIPEAEKRKLIKQGNTYFSHRPEIF